MGKTDSMSSPAEKEEKSSFKFLQWNAEGIARKKLSLSNKMKELDVDVAVIQETHLRAENNIKIPGYRPFTKNRKNRHKGGVITLVKNSIPATEIKMNLNESEEIIGIRLALGKRTINLYNYYCPPDTDHALYSMAIKDTDENLVIGDFNSHSPSWGYENLDTRGEEVEDWCTSVNLQLVNQADDPCTFFSRAWRTMSTPDLAFASNSIAQDLERDVLDQLGGSDHRPILLTLSVDHQRPTSLVLPRWNYKKANWSKYSNLSDQYLAPINARSKKVSKVAKEICDAILTAARECIPRGARKEYRPYWTPELGALENAVTAARNQVERDPTIPNNIALKAATARLTKTTTEVQRKAWHEKTSKLSLDREGKKLWKLASALNEDKCKHRSITIEDDGKMLSGKAAADAFMKTYAKTSDLDIDKNAKKRVTLERRDLRNQQLPGNEDIMNKPFNIAELEEALSTLKPCKSPGPDEVTNELLQNLGPKARKILLALFNSSWKYSEVPQKWREAIMIPIHKPGKPKEVAGSYRPVSLTSCMCKTMERMVNARMTHHLEEMHLLIDEQNGFRRFRSTEDQVTYIAQHIEDAFQEKKQMAVIWVDLEKAFDQVWKDGALLKLQHNGFKGRMLKWIEKYLSRRSGRVRVGNSLSRSFTLRHGVPQGGVISPTLFSVFVNDIKEILPKGVKAAIYADDLALWSAEEFAGTAQIRLQTALENLEKWTRDWNIRINTKKTTYTLFTLSTKPRDLKLIINGQALQEDDAPKYLGVTFDRRLTWKNHIQKCQTKAATRTALLRKLAGTEWGADLNVLRKVYTGYVRPTMDYGITAWGNAAASNFKKVCRVQNQNLRIMTGALKSTPIELMERTTGLQSMEDRRDGKILIQGQKFKALTNHPMHERMDKPMKKRLKRPNFLQKKKDLDRSKLVPAQSQHIKPLKLTSSCPSWNRDRLPSIQESVPGIQKKNQHSTEDIRQKTTEMLAKRYPSNTWIRIYTDGSAVDAIEDGGAGVYIEFPDGSIMESSIPTGKHSSNYKAEGDAMLHAIETITSRNIDGENICILTDAKSMLQSLNKTSTDFDLDELRIALSDLQKRAKKVDIQWIPGHCNIHGNEEADRLAKEGSRMQQIEEDLTLQEFKTAVKSAMKEKFEKDHPGYDKHDPFLQLNKRAQTIIFRLRSGHNRLAGPMFHRFKIGQSDMCTCGIEIQDTEHILQRCPKFQEERQTIWPRGASLNRKLNGTLTDLEDTVRFIIGTGLAI